VDPKRKIRTILNRHLRKELTKREKEHLVGEGALLPDKQHLAAEWAAMNAYKAVDEWARKVAATFAADTTQDREFWCMVLRHASDILDPVDVRMRNLKGH
jgi:hypothetical protein